MIKKIFQNLLLSVLLLSGCATTHATKVDPNDPFERFNREAFLFNHDVDQVFLKPVAELYKKVTPWQICRGVTNVFSNLNELPTIANDVLQLKLLQATSDAWRFAFNSFVGIGGIFDVATQIGLPHHKEDFGLTLARWGWKKSTYLVLPFIGSTTVRDAPSIFIDYYAFTIFPHIDWQWRWGLLSLAAVNYRASLLSVEGVADTAALDQYVFFRNAYIQKRQQQIAQNDHTTAANHANENTSTAGSDDDILKGIDLDSNG